MRLSVQRLSHLHAWQGAPGFILFCGFGLGIRAAAASSSPSSVALGPVHKKDVSDRHKHLQALLIFINLISLYENVQYLPTSYRFQ